MDQPLKTYETLWLNSSSIYLFFWGKCPTYATGTWHIWEKYPYSLTNTNAQASMNRTINSIQIKKSSTKISIQRLFAWRVTRTRVHHDQKNDSNEKTSDLSIRPRLLIFWIWVLQSGIQDCWPLKNATSQIVMYKIGLIVLF